MVDVLSNEVSVLQGEGISDESLIGLAREIMQRTSIRLDDIIKVETRHDALLALERIALAAANNPLLMVIEELGALPPMVTILYPNKDGEAASLEVQL